MKNEDTAGSSAVIELSTVHFYKGDLEPTIALKDMGLMLSADIPGTLSALYGHQSKQDGFMVAGKYADRHHLQFTVIDFLVRLDYRLNPGLMKPEQLMNHDFLNFQRASRAMLDEIDSLLTEKLEGQVLDEKFVGKPDLLVLEKPELVAHLLSSASMAHVKVLVHAARTQFSERPLNVGTIAFSQWDAIQEATCRLNPGTRVSLERPGPIDKAVQIERRAPGIEASQPSTQAPPKVRRRSS